MKMSSHSPLGFFTIFLCQFLCSLGQALRDVGRNMRAAEVWLSVSKLQPDHPMAHYRRGACLRAIDRNQEALAALRYWMEWDIYSTLVAGWGGWG